MATTHFRPPTDQRSGPRLQIVIGGDRLQVLLYPDVEVANLKLGADVLGELAQIAVDVEGGNVHLIPLADGETARTLAADAAPEILQAIEQRAGTNTQHGLGQLRTDGSLAVAKLISSAAFLSFFNDVVVPQLLAYGPLSHIDLVFKAGSSGATGSDGVIVCSPGLSVLLRERLGVTVSITLEYTGGIVNAIHGANTALNAGACIIDAVDFATDPAQDPRETRSVVFHELPAMMERDTRARDRFMLQTEQARGAQQVREIFNRLAPNRSLRGKFGGISILRFDFHQQLDERREVARDTARSLSAELQPVLNSPNLSLIQELAIGTEEWRRPQEPLASIIERAWVSDAEELDAAICQPGIQAACHLVAELRDGQSIALANIRQFFATPPQTGSEAAYRRSLLVECLQKLDRRRLELEDEGAEIEADLQDSRQAMRKALRAIHPRTAWQAWKARLTSAEKKKKCLETAAAQYRLVDDDLQLVLAALGAVAQAEHLLQMELDFLQEKLTNIRDLLERFQPRGQSADSQPLLVTKSLDAMFTQLWRLTPTEPDEKVLKVLCFAAKWVTLQGLAQITRADFPRVDHIARQISLRKVAIAGPPWGGRSRPGEELCIHVLPPLAPADEQSLRKCIQKEDGGAHVAFADTASAGVNVLDIHVETVTKLLDVLPAYYLNGAQRAAAPDQRPVFFPRGLGAAERLGLLQILLSTTITPSSQGA